MSNQEILEKAIQKAIDGGWSPGWQDRRPVVSWGAEYSTEYDEGEGVMVIAYHAKSNASTWFFHLKELIFNHGFAKALWGEKTDDEYKDLKASGYTGNGKYGRPTSVENAGWQHHLQMMVIAEDPVQYLGENL